VLQSHRRQFLQEVGGGMLAVLVGSGLAAELGLAAEDGKEDQILLGQRRGVIAGRPGRDRRARWPEQDRLAEQEQLILTGRWRAERPGVLARRGERCRQRSRLGGRARQWCQEQALDECLS